LHQASLSNSIAMSVQGPIDSRALGFIRPHEHIFIGTSSFFVPVAAECDGYREDIPISLLNLSWIRYNARHNRDCLRVMDEENATHEIGLFAQAAGDTIIDLTSQEMGRNPIALARINRSTHVNIIVETGFYTAATHLPNLAIAHVGEIAAEMISAITVGVNGTGIKAGIIGEIGCS
jgi:phosphotriesterase-related protein